MNRHDIFLICLAGAGLILAFPPLPFGFVATVVLIPFFFFLRDKRLSSVLTGGYLIGLIWGSGTIYWIGWATIGGLFGALLIFASYFCLFSLVQFFLVQLWGEKSLLAAPFLWTGIEMLSSLGPMGFPWNLMAHTQSYYLTMIQYADLFGVYAVSFWVVSMNVIIYFIIIHLKKRQLVQKWILCLVFFVLVPLGYGQYKLTRPLDNDPKINVSLVQGNIDPYQKWDAGFLDSNFSVYARLTRQAFASDPELIIWPETATACYIRYRVPYFQKIKLQVDSMNVPLLTGTQDFEWINKDKLNRYNSAFLIRPNHWQVDRYHKIHPVPFSERVPLGDTFPFWYNFLDKVLDLSVGNYAVGDSIVVFQFIPKSLKKPVRFSVVICYESVFPYLVRKFIRQGAQFLVIITNDGWFGKTSGPFQHARIAVFRAIENRIWIARCANTGISAFIDPYGRTYNVSNIYQEAVINSFISVKKQVTFFTKCGFVFPWFVGIMDGLLLLLAVYSRGFHRR